MPKGLRKIADEESRLRDWLLDRSTILIVAALTAALFFAQYNGRVRLTQSDREQCALSMVVRFHSMEAWYGAFLARRADAVAKHEGPFDTDWIASETYLDFVRSAMRLVSPQYSLIWPDPTVSRRGPFTHPLGMGSYSCKRAWPDPPFIQL